ncbi:MAG: metalloregulator ArsR/SmtB family transcription factor [Hyphomicrobiales bacterium]|nr:metalloregulator ArsR/SmtB family transcription factor [Hyphomicrobiales bacterium]
MNLTAPNLARPFDASRLLAQRFAALSHPARIDILKHLARLDACCCGDVVQKFDLAQSTVSQHLKVLVEAGLVSFEPDRRRSRYRINREALSGLSESVATLVSTCCSSR